MKTAMKKMMTRPIVTILIPMVTSRMVTLRVVDLVIMMTKEVTLMMVSMSVNMLMLVPVPVTKGLLLQYQL